MQHTPKTLELTATNRDNFVFFFGKESPFSQFYPVNFEVDGKIYNCTEQFIMYQKAIMFKDMKNGKRIMSESNPLSMKQLGRLIQGFDKEIWESEAPSVVKRGNFAKFRQNPILEDKLFHTYPKVLVESSPNDCLWGIGLGENNEKAWNITTWRGKNLLGFTLMEVRHLLMSHKGNL